MKTRFKKTIYLDHASATPLDEKVAKAMAVAARDIYANPSAIHTGGVKAKQVLENTREIIAKRLFAHSDEIIFTGSGTESDALAIWGVIYHANRSKRKSLPHIITTSIEHPAVLENCNRLKRDGLAEVTYVTCDADGIIDPKEIKKAFKENTVLVSVMYANNEIGTIQPIQEIAKTIRHFRKEHETPFPFFHTDAAQAMQYLSTDNVEKLGVDLLSFNSSKLYGPKGVGVLYKKRSVELEAVYNGGGQESGLRSGTENVVSIIGAALAFEKACAYKEKETARLIKIRDYGIERLLELSDASGYRIALNGHRENRLPNNINISVEGISSELLVIELDARGILVSAKSACKSDDPDESYVIRALHEAQGIAKETIDGSIRISLGRSTTKKDIDALTTALKQILDTYKKWQ